jgi:hypothetical protein
MVGSGSLELSTGGSGGIDRPLRPVANDDHEGPGRRDRAVAAVIEMMHRQRYGWGESSRAYIGTSPDQLLRRKDVGSLALGSEIATGDSSTN